MVSIPAVGPITALTSALEVANLHHFPSIGDAVSYSDLTTAFRSSSGKQGRDPLSKPHNKGLQMARIEAAKLAPRWNPHEAIDSCAQFSTLPCWGNPFRRVEGNPRFLLTFIYHGCPRFSMTSAININGGRPQQQRK